MQTHRIWTASPARDGAGCSGPSRRGSNQGATSRTSASWATTPAPSIPGEGRLKRPIWESPSGTGRWPTAATWSRFGTGRWRTSTPGTSRAPRVPNSSALWTPHSGRSGSTRGSVTGTCWSSRGRMEPGPPHPTTSSVSRWRRSSRAGTMLRSSSTAWRCPGRSLPTTRSICAVERRERPRQPGSGRGAAGQDRRLRLSWRNTDFPGG